jgi:cytoskeletal protein CcmA (bactofilin family)
MQGNLLTAEYVKIRSVLKGEQALRATIDGVGSLYGGSYDEVSINGVGKLKDDIKANIINVNGVFKSKGWIEAGSFISDGVSRVHNDIKVKELKVDGVLKLAVEKWKQIAFVAMVL